MASLGDFALACDSLQALFRCAAATIADQLGVDAASVTQATERGPVVVASSGAAAGDELCHGLTLPIVCGRPASWGFVAARCRQERSFPAADVDFLRAVAACLGQAIAREYAEESLEVRARQQSALAELSRLVVKCVDGSTLLRACDILIERLGVEHAVYFELDPTQQVLRYRAGNRWFPDSLMTLPVNASTYGAECVMRNATVIVDDYATDTRFASTRSLLDWGVRSGLIVPVSNPHGCLGVLTAHSRERRSFSEDDILFCEAVANILAEGLERDGVRRDLAISENRYRDIVETASDIIFTTTIDGHFVALNPAFERITGYPIVDWLGRSVLDLAENPGYSAELLARMAEAPHARTPFVADVPVRGAAGTVLLELSMTVRRQEGEPLAIHGFARDVTEARRAERERRALEAKLEQANRIAGLGRLAATMAHEFNNVLMGMAPFLDLLRKGKNVETALKHMGQAVARGRRITEDILRFTRPAEPSRSSVAVEPWLQSVLEDGRSLLPPSVQLEAKTPGGELFISGDAAQLQQVFTNLILNARDAMPSGGTITIELACEAPDAELRFAVVDPHRYAHLTLRDTGCGMNEEMLRHAFEPLFTTKRNGTGLGLPVALQVVQRHGGELFVESEPGAGTTFHIFLPLTEAPVITRPREVYRRAATPDAKLVVLVEDDPIVAAGLVSLLTLGGSAVRLARTGQEALAVLRRVQPDLVILDVGLPDMDGTQVFLELQKTLQYVPVIFSTGHADRTKIEDLLARPNVGFLLKPYAHADLLEMMMKVTTAKAA
ncbi:MAG TPA: ATP-binding protein [Thermoanaerobaculia bacterium]|nr:ATP-binding protein [Thermoanaerobaculia bacterium]